MGIIFSSFNGLEVSPKLRFKDENGVTFPCWKKYTLSHFLSSRVEKQIPTNEAPLMAFTAEGGVTDKGERYDRSFLVKSADKLYKRTEFNDFIYSSNNLDVGSIGLNKYGTAVISDVYEIFSVNKNGAPDFISELIQRPFTLHKVLKFRQGCLYGQYRIYASDFLSVSVFAPQLKEQKKINNFLSLIDKRIEKQRQLVESLKKYKRGLLYLFFETKKPNKKLSELIKIGKAGGTPLSSNPNYYNGKIPFLSISDMTNQGKYLYSTDKYISDEGLSNSAAWLVPVNSLIISMYASYGLVAINKIELSTSQAMFNIIPQEPNDIEFLYYYLSYLSFTGYYDKMVSTGTQPNLNAEKIKNIPIYIPLDKKEKEKISKMLLTFEDKEKQAQKILSNLEQLKNGLLQQMFI